MKDSSLDSRHGAAIIPLCRAPEHAAECARWAYDEWYRRRDMDPEIVYGAFRRRAGRADMPFTLIAVDRNAPVGMATLKLKDLRSMPELGPWLSSLYVIPSRRGEGIGTSLICAVAEEARRRGFHELYLFLGQRHMGILENFYTKRQWRRIATALDNDGLPTKVFRLELKQW